MMLLSILLSCTHGGPDDLSDTTAEGVADLASPDATNPLGSSEIEIDGPTLQAIAEREVARDPADPRDPKDALAQGVLVSQSGLIVYLFGWKEDVDLLTRGDIPSGPVEAVFLDRSGTCLGRVGDISRLFEDSSDLLSGSWDPNIEGSIEACRVRTVDAKEVAGLAANLTDEAREFLMEIDGFGARSDDPVAPPASCSVSCGTDDGYTYAGQQAYSNGADTGKSSSCTYSNCSCGGSSTYGYLYQCVEFTERVHQRSDWGGNAYTGYWSQTGLSSGTSSQGPYYKSLLPLGSGTVYAAPQAGDVVVWYKSGTYGHVGIIASVSGSYITVYDQNRSCGDQSCKLSYSGASPWTLSNGSSSGYCGAEGVSSYSVVGYLRRGWDFGGTYGLASNSSTGASTHNWWPNDASYVSGTISGSVTDITDYITINPGTTDPYLTSPAGLQLPASNTYTYGYKYFSLYIKSDCSNKVAALYWRRTTDSSFAETRKVTATISGSSWQTLTFDPSTNSDWSGTIDQVRIDPASSCSSSSSDTISMQSAYFSR